MPYYHDIIVEKSWKALCALRQKYKFILIGGWAVFLYTKALKSRDIDFVCDYDELMKLKSDYDLIKNDRLKKYEIHTGEFDVDIYVPFYSELAIPVPDLARMAKSLDGFEVLSPEALLILKQKAYLDRGGSMKGEKDKIDIISLLNSPINFAGYKRLLKKYHLENFRENLIRLLKETREVPELSLGRHTLSKLKKSVLPELSL